MKTLSIAAAVLVALAAEAKNVRVDWDPSSAVTNCVDAQGNPSTNCPSISYNVFVYTNSAAIAFTNQAVAVYPTTNTTVTLTNIAPGTIYYANVNAQDANGLTSDLSSTVSFAYPGAPTSVHIVP